MTTKTARKAMHVATTTWLCLGMSLPTQIRAESKPSRPSVSVHVDGAEVKLAVETPQLLAYDQLMQLSAEKRRQYIAGVRSLVVELEDQAGSDFATTPAPKGASRSASFRLMLEDFLTAMSGPEAKAVTYFEQGGRQFGHEPSPECVEELGGNPDLFGQQANCPSGLVYLGEDSPGVSACGPNFMGRLGPPVGATREERRRNFRNCPTGQVVVGRCERDRHAADCVLPSQVGIHARQGDSLAEMAPWCGRTIWGVEPGCEGRRFTLNAGGVTYPTPAQRQAADRALRAQRGTPYRPLPRPAVPPGSDGIIGTFPVGPESGMPGDDSAGDPDASGVGDVAGPQADAEPAAGGPRVRRAAPQVPAARRAVTASGLCALPQRQCPAPDSREFARARAAFEAEASRSGSADCLYAGMPSTYRDGRRVAGRCSAQTQFCLRAGDPSSCKSPQGQDLRCGAGQAICNPLVFGIKSDGRPFCVSAQSQATRSCDQIATARNSASDFLAQNSAGIREAWDAMRDRLTSLCGDRSRLNRRAAATASPAAILNCGACNIISQRLSRLNGDAGHPCGQSSEPTPASGSRTAPARASLDQPKLSPSDRTPASLGAGRLGGIGRFAR